jgi:hypothetical protein
MHKNLERLINDMLTNHKDNLIIKSELEEENDGSELEGDLTRNLFTLVCAMLGLSVKQKGRTTLDDRLLSQYLVQITYSSEEAIGTPTPETMLDDEIMAIHVPLHLQIQGDVSGYQYVDGEMLSVSSYTIADQLTCIKSLINRPSFSLNEKQLRMISTAFANWSAIRENFFNR